MSSRRALGPRLEGLEPKTLMSAGASPRPALVVGEDERRSTPRLASPVTATDLASSRLEMVTLGGRIQGSFTSHQGVSSSGTRFRLSATGPITPIGTAVAVGTFHTPGFVDGVAHGTLTIIGPDGSLHLDLRGPRPFAARTREGTPTRSIRTFP